MNKKKKTTRLKHRKNRERIKNLIRTSQLKARPKKVKVAKEIEAAPPNTLGEVKKKVAMKSSTKKATKKTTKKTTTNKQASKKISAEKLAAKKKSVKKTIAKKTSTKKIVPKKKTAEIEK